MTSRTQRPHSHENSNFMQRRCGLKSKITVIGFSLFLVIAGCYHATVETGLAPSNQVISKAWASGWVYGLVPPSTVETAAKCPNGVAMVETKLSFLNQVVSGLTFGIYTPMSIKVTCAERGGAGLIEPKADIVVAHDASPEEIRAAFAQAARQSVETGRAVFVRFAELEVSPNSGT